MFFMTSLEHSYISSSLVKEIAHVRRRRVGDGARRGGRSRARAERAGRHGRGRAAARAIIRGNVPPGPRAHRRPSAGHHLPRRAARIADRERQVTADDAQRDHRSGRRPQPHRRAPRRRARRGSRGEADQPGGGADHREGPGGGRADRRPCPGAGRVPHRRAWPHRGRRGGEPPDHRASPRRTPPASGRAPTTTRPGSSRGSRPTSPGRCAASSGGSRCSTSGVPRRRPQRRVDDDYDATSRGAAGDWSRTRRRPRPPGGDDLVRLPRGRTPSTRTATRSTFALSGLMAEAPGHGPRVRDRAASTSTPGTASSSTEPVAGTMRALAAPTAASWSTPG